MTANFFRKYADLIIEAEMNEKAPPGKEDWVRKHKQEFIDRYGRDKGLSVLYATAWKQHNENTDVDYSSHTEPNNQNQSQPDIYGSGASTAYHSGPGKPIIEKHIGFAKLEKQIDKNPKVKDPGAVAAAIGRKKYGQAGMTRRSVAGRS